MSEPPRTQPDYYPMGDDAPAPSPDVFIEATIDEKDPVAVARRDRLREKIFEVFFGTEEERESGKRLVFEELSKKAVYAMPPELRADYESELAPAQDPRSDRIYRSRKDQSN